MPRSSETEPQCGCQPEAAVVPGHQKRPQRWGGTAGCRAPSEGQGKENTKESKHTVLT